MRRIKLVSALLLLVSLSSLAATKARAWQEGTLKDVTSEPGSRIVGTMNQGHGTVVQARNDATFYFIETADYTYVAKRTLTRRGDKQVPVTVNDPVKFAIEKDDFYLLDEKGKEHKLTLEKKIRNQK
jgi:hypothetical protein